MEAMHNIVRRTELELKEKHRRYMNNKHKQFAKIPRQNPEKIFNWENPANFVNNALQCFKLESQDQHEQNIEAEIYAPL